MGLVNKYLHFSFPIDLIDYNCHVLCGLSKYIRVNVFLIEYIKQNGESRGNIYHLQALQRLKSLQRKDKEAASLWRIPYLSIYKGKENLEFDVISSRRNMTSVLPCSS